jgi:hypothetical protein
VNDHPRHVLPAEYICSARVAHCLGSQYYYLAEAYRRHGIELEASALRRATMAKQGSAEAEVRLLQLEQTPQFGTFI